jgi:hypothetical protein
MSSFSLQIDMNCRRKSRSYLEKRNEVVLASTRTLYYVPEFAIFRVHIELKLRAHDAFGIWNGSKIIDDTNGSKGRRKPCRNIALGGGREVKMTRLFFGQVRLG